ncbi:oocyte zinc finger protein XlCOF8.4-like isoform X1 [Pseudophryne corroboree]|uniref:oocyte zinc finger protein XlCOF8.4-like isoform X1 n=1 Tax=Pseudophryne corroboree TaxID=495146 RepID=UPI0030812ADA
MDKTRIHRSETLLNLTLEIIHLLTGEDYTVVKKSKERVKRCNPPRASKKLSKTQSSITKAPPHSLVHDRDNDQKILELTNKIIQLLTGEEGQYIDEQEEMFEETTMENHQPLTFVDGASNRATPEIPSSPLQSQDCTEENHSVPQEDQEENLSLVKEEDTEEEEEEHLLVKVEDTEGEEDYERDDQQCEEEIPTDIGTADGYNNENTSEEHFVSPDHEIEGENMAQDSADENPVTPSIDPVLHSADVSSDPAYLADYAPDDSDIETYIRALGVEYLFPSPIDGNCFSQHIGFNTYQPVETGSPPFPRSGRRKYLEDKSNAVPRKRRRRAARSMPCPECGKCFRDNCYLMQHRRLHTGELPFPCNMCPKRFMNQSSLAVHIRSHTGERPYSCPECGKCFINTSHRKEHLRMHTGEKPYLCTECGKSFTSKSGLVAHTRSHTGEKPYSCPECGKRFQDKGGLVIHGRSHTGEKPFSCLECGKCYTQKKHMIEHQRKHTGERPFPCVECGKRFIKKSHLVAHQTLHTRNK